MRLKYPSSRERRLPLVSVVTPFYNTAEYLEECIQSVLSQSYHNYEYILLNNCSDDGSKEIAEKYAALDERIKLFENESLLPQVPNYNRALQHISPESVYCKMVQADDWIFPQCLEEMVAVAEERDSISLVGAYGLFGRTVYLDGLTVDERILSGREVCRRFFFRNLYVFGSPTSVLFRSSDVRSKEHFFDLESPVEDAEVCFELLRDRDFGYVHQVLTFTRRDNESIMTSVGTFEPQKLLKLLALHKFGEHYLDQDELRACLKKAKQEYRRALGEAKLRRRTEAFWDFHKRGLATISERVNQKDVWLGAINAMTDYLFNPWSTAQRLLAMKTRR